MDSVKQAAETAVNAANNNNQQHGGQNSNDGQSSNNNGLGFISGNSAVDGVLGNLNGALGGGKQGEAKEEKVFKEGPQDKEPFVEQAKDESISDFIREVYKGMTGTGFP
ncbi:hypothetical protein EST38_g4313 [Candolleomyces aberdarensis]|uniref:Uncharacterized protein n=1 Tax=Candolleomyces aberdarensis TaxID=2316362 RepID=A0A4Q2DNB3_9AGAR|nr:hypothetical protein EST38_g4313 [Candolleomyces aberdarensis]